MRIDFASPVLAVSGFFTYNTPLLLQAFDPSSVLLDTLLSMFSANTALTGDVGSLPNELLSLDGGNIAYVTVLGNPLGGSFALDDLSVISAVPEPATWALIVAVAAVVTLLAPRRRARA